MVSDIRDDRLAARLGDHVSIAPEKRINQ